MAARYPVALTRANSVVTLVSVSRARESPRLGVTAALVAGPIAAAVKQQRRCWFVGSALAGSAQMPCPSADNAAGRGAVVASTSASALVMMGLVATAKR